MTIFPPTGATAAFISPLHDVSDLLNAHASSAERLVRQIVELAHEMSANSLAVKFWITDDKERAVLILCCTAVAQHDAFEQQFKSGSRFSFSLDRALASTLAVLVLVLTPLVLLEPWFWSHRYAACLEVSSCEAAAAGGLLQGRASDTDFFFCRSEEFTGDQGLALVDEGKGRAQSNSSVRQARPQERKRNIRGLNRQNETMSEI